MTIQEEIREGMINTIMHSSDLNIEEATHLTDSILMFQNINGVVIKVDEKEIEAVDSFGASYKTKCVAVESLIETDDLHWDDRAGNSVED